jgi:signal transduction histidine kinase
MDQTFIIDDGTSFKQRVFDSSDEIKFIVEVIQALSQITDPELLMGRTCLAAWHLFPTSVVVLTTLKEGAFHFSKVVSHGKVVPMTTIYAAEVTNNGITPKDSLSTRVASMEKPVMWIEGGKNTLGRWYHDPSMLGVPWFDAEGTLCGTIIATFGDGHIPSESQVILFQTLAEAFSTSYSTAQKYQNAYKAGQAIEQEMIAHKLHDTAVQNVFSIQLKIKRILEREGISEALQSDLLDLSEMVRETQDDLRI